MDLSENRIFFEEVVLIHFPALNTYLNQASLSLTKTIDAWQETLHDVTTDEALSVIHRWTRDELPRPAYLELADFALHLRGVVMRDRADRKKAAVMDMIRDREEGSKDFSRVTLRPFIRRIMESGEAVKAGKITLEQHKANTDAVLADHDRAYKQTRYGNG